MEFTVPVLSRSISCVLKSTGCPVSDTDCVEENVYIPEDMPVYRKTYVDSKSRKQKRNKFQHSEMTIEVSENEIQITHQVAFVLDITGSMQPEIDSVRNEIVPVIETLKTEATSAIADIPPVEGKHFSLNFEVAVIGYRDFGDSCHFQTHDFTSDIDTIKQFLSTLCATGGDDAPEDVKGAFIHALYGVSNIADKLQWKSETASKSIFLITDAPAHGMMFHESGIVGDNYRDDSEEEWKMILREMKTHNISFNVIKINANTTKMCSAFREMCQSVELPYVEIDISQKIVRSEGGGYGRPMLERAYREHPPELLSGEVSAHLSSMCRMTSAGYARERSVPIETTHTEYA